MALNCCDYTAQHIYLWLIFKAGLMHQRRCCCATALALC